MLLELSPEQRQAVDVDGGALVVTASAGSGKTEVVARRVERLLDESRGELFRVLALSYTVKAADELRARLVGRLGDTRRVETETIHAFAHNLIRQHGTWEGLPLEPEVLYRDEDRVDLLMTWLENRGTFLDPAEGESALQEIDLARARCREARYLSDYVNALEERGALDYPAMLDVACRLLENEWLRSQLRQTYRHLIVDEAQNLTLAQYRLLVAILGPPPSPINAMMVGDEKQSIVQFAGADPSLITKFKRDYGAQHIVLRQNFRSATALAGLANTITTELGEGTRLAIASAAAGAVDFVEFGTEKEEGVATANWITDLLDGGLPQQALAAGESPVVRSEEIAVLARTGSTLRWTAEALEEGGVDYVLGSDPRNWMSSRLGQAVADLIAYRAGPAHLSAQVHLAESASVSIDELESSPLAGFAELVQESGETEPAELFAAMASVVKDADVDGQWVDDEEVLNKTWQSFLDRTPRGERSYVNLQLHIARTQRGEPSAPGVRLLTVHRSQGREFRAVAIVGLNQGQFPDFRQSTADELRAELHCFYVAVTRASRVLRLSRSRQRMGRNGLWESAESEYLTRARAAVSG